MQIRVSVDPTSEAAASIARRVRIAVRRRGSAALALSGGSTAPAMIAALLAFDLPWESLTAWQVDERVAPDGHADRNALQLRTLPCAVRLMPVTASDLRAAAARYARSLPERFDVVHLGVGDDGHTASWPPGDTQVIASERAVEVVGEFRGRPRMTLTPRVVNAARSRVVLATGSGKRDVLRRWIAGDRTLPVSVVRRRDTVLFLDPAAAPGN